MYTATGCGTFKLVREYTHNRNWLPASLRRIHGCGQIGLGLGRVLRRWASHVLATLIALELGLLSPLSCVIHCVIQQLLTERSAIAFFLCGEHGRMSVAAPSVQPANVYDRFTPDTTSTPISTIKPQALYELVSLDSSLITVVSLLVAVLIAPPARRLASLIHMPPTPPPRLSPV